MILIKYLRRERAGAGLARAAVGTAVAQKEERPCDAAANPDPSKNGGYVVWGETTVPCCCATVRMKCGGTTRRPPERRRRKVRLVAAYDLEVQLAAVDFLRCQKILPQARRCRVATRLQGVWGAPGYCEPTA